MLQRWPEALYTLVLNQTNGIHEPDLTIKFGISVIKRWWKCVILASITQKKKETTIHTLPKRTFDERNCELQVQGRWKIKSFVIIYSSILMNNHTRYVWCYLVCICMVIRNISVNNGPRTKVKSLKLCPSFMEDRTAVYNHYFQNQFVHKKVKSLYDTNYYIQFVKWCLQSILSPPPKKKEESFNKFGNFKLFGTQLLNCHVTLVIATENNANNRTEKNRHSEMSRINYACLEKRSQSQTLL